MMEGVKKSGAKASLQVLKNQNLEAVNTLDDPENIVPVEQDLKVKGRKANLALEPYSLSVLKD